jgi:hypothetical protein
MSEAKIKAVTVKQQRVLLHKGNNWTGDSRQIVLTDNEETRRQR